MTPVALSRWLGSKRWLCRGYPHLLPLPRRRGRAFDVFAGGCSVALWYLAQGYRVVIGDTNARLIGCLTWIKMYERALIEHLTEMAAQYAADTDPRGYFYAARAQLNQCRPYTTEGAALFLFILRTGFNGLWRENAAGECNTPVGDCTTGWGDPLNSRRKSYASRGAIPFRKDLVRADELRAISALLQKADIRHGDFEATAHDIRTGDVAFADAPYAPDTKGKAFTGYSKGGFGKHDRARLAMWLRSLDKRGIRWTATDARTEHSLATYGLWTVDEVDVRRSVAAKGDARGSTKEILVRNWHAALKEAA